MQDDHFGQRLRAERERRRITLESIAANTKISIALLRDLEADRLKHWPGGIFRRSFVKSYAEAVGLDADETLQAFLDAHPEPQVAADGTVAPPPPAPRRGAAPVMRLALADEPYVFRGGTLLTSARGRLLAVLCDLGIPLALAGLAWLVTGTFWSAFGMSLLVYLGGGILVLGNTPGVYLAAPGAPWPAPPPVEGDDAGHLAIFEESLIR